MDAMPNFRVYSCILWAKRARKPLFNKVIVINLSKNSPVFATSAGQCSPLRPDIPPPSLGRFSQFGQNWYAEGGSPSAAVLSCLYCILYPISFRKNRSSRSIFTCLFLTKKSCPPSQPERTAPKLWYEKTDRNGVARISHPKTSIVLSHNSIAVHCFCAQSLIFTALYKHFYIPWQHKNNLL